MAGPCLPEVERIVERFLAARRNGRHPSIDEVIADEGAAMNANAVRSSALIELAERARTRCVSSAGGDSLATDHDEPFPELDGYDIVDRVGVGGMGTVYEAYQRATGRRVATKFMHACARLSETARQRFEREVELIARLQHPGITAIIDSGIDRGNYYYVMEYVDGRQLDEAILPGASAPAEVLRCLATIADAVDYAHQRGILHRDLKPSNVMIDTEGSVHLLDFGLAKCLAADAVRQTDATLSRPGQLIGTLAYMSPEQSRAQPELTSVRSDVYSLGAMAYELLTGRLPCSIDGPLDEVIERIVRHDPPPPSSLRRGLSRDLDAVVLTALDKEPARRYSTAAALARDLRACLEARPVSARRIGLSGRTWRWVRRNRTLATVSAMAAIAIVAVTAIAVERIGHARQRTIQRGQQAQRTLAAMQDMLATGDPEHIRGVDVTLREKLGDWEAALADYASEPLMEASLCTVLGRLALQCGEYERAQRNLCRAVELLEEHGDDPSNLADAVFALARSLHKQTRYAEAEALYARALELRRAELGPNDPAVAEALNGYAWVLKDQDRLDDAESIYRDALDILRRSPEDTRDALASIQQNLAQLLTKTSRYDEAEQLFRESLQARRSLYGPEHQHVASTLATLGSMLRENGDLAAAEPPLRQALDMRIRLLGREHPSTIISMNLLGLLLRDIGRLDEAESLLREALDLRIAALGTREHDFVAVSLYNVATVRLTRGDPEEAESLLREALSIWQTLLPDFEHHHKTAYGLYSLAEVMLESGDLSAARRLCIQTLTLRRALYNDGDHPEIAQSLLLLARIELADNDASSAERNARDAWAIMQRLPSGHRWRVRGLRVLGDTVFASNRYDEAESTLLASLEEGRLRLGLDHPDTQRTIRSLIELCQSSSQPDQARRYSELIISPATP